MLIHFFITCIFSLASIALTYFFSNSNNLINNMPIFLVIFIFPIFEELFFRAYLLTFLEQKTKYSNLIQALIFSILHFNNIQKIYTFFFALYLGYVAKKENIYLCIILHILFNLIGIYLFKIMPLYYTRFTSIILTSF